MKWNEIKWNAMQCNKGLFKKTRNEMKWNEMKWSAIKDCLRGLEMK